MADPIFLIAPLQFAVDIDEGGYSYGRRLSGTRRDLHNIQEGTYLVYKTLESESEEENIRKKQKTVIDMESNLKLSFEDLKKLESSISLLTSGKLENLIQEFDLSKQTIQNLTKEIKLLKEESDPYGGRKIIQEFDLSKQTIQSLTKEIKLLKEESDLYGGRKMNRNLAAISLIEYGLQLLTLSVRQIVRLDPSKYFGKENVFFSGYIEDVVYSRMIMWVIKSSEDRPGCGSYTLAVYWSRYGYEGFGLGDEWLQERKKSKTSSQKCEMLLKKAEAEFGACLEPSFSSEAVRMAMGLYISCLRTVRNEDVHNFRVLQFENSNASHQKPKSLEQRRERLELASKLVYRTFSLSSLKGKLEILQDVLKNLSSLGKSFEKLNPMLKALGHHWEHVTMPNLIATTVRKSGPCDKTYSR